MAEDIRTNIGFHTLVARNMDPNKYLEKVIGARFSEYREKWDRVASADSSVVLDFPLHLNFEVSWACNYKCNMCPCSLPPHKWGYKENEPSKTISLDRYKSIIDEGASCGLGAVALHGYNEPLLQKDLVEYIKYAKEKKIPDIFTITNGLLLTEERANELVDSGLTRIIFSIDAATPETYSKVRKEGDYEVVVRNIEYFIDLIKKNNLQLPITRVSFVRSKLNYFEQQKFEEYWKDKVDYILVQRFTNPFLGNDNFQSVEDEYRHEDSDPLQECYQPFQRLYITNNGDVHPCCSAYGMKMMLGNINDSTIKEIWDGPAAAHIRSTVNAEEGMQPEACIMCRQASAMKNS